MTQTNNHENGQNHDRNGGRDARGRFQPGNQAARGCACRRFAVRIDQLTQDAALWSCRSQVGLLAIVRQLHGTLTEILDELAVEAGGEP